VIIGVHAVNAYFVPAAPRLQRDDAGLSQREWDIVELVTKGYTNREVGELLSISRKTVTNHLYHIYKKVGVKNRVELLAELNALLQEPLE
jgi:DNA-binding CsgD family transcriptional regulator